ncbi:MAG: hypothetical protein XXXJIFNMEKO3_00651 [Candidatus Erwinia impunctatus]|nr:hypothetical protein XXXJIFNMEKO_00651 [Culicoides impunctatus]
MRMNLEHHFLIAMPGLHDPLFKRAVIYLCEHNDEGAMGLIINKPMESLTIEGMLKKLSIKPEPRNASIDLDKPVMAGGPLAQDRGFILHSAERKYASSILVSDNTVLTTSCDVLETLGTDEQPENVLVTLGYCAWEKDQLENELLENAWLTGPANSNILFRTPIPDRWRDAARSIGVDVQRLINDPGHA